jgi:hypothetical protein
MCSQWAEGIEREALEDRIAGRWDSAKLGSDHAMAPVLFSFASLLHKPWFTRLRVVQEVMVAKEATFLSGSSRIPEATLSQAVLRLFTQISKDSEHVLSCLHDSGVLDNTGDNLWRACFVFRCIREYRLRTQG